MRSVCSRVPADTPDWNDQLADSNSTGEYGKPPCLKCYYEGAHCVLASSRRGGDYSRHRQRASAGFHENARRYARFGLPSRSVDPGTAQPDLSSPGRNDTVEHEDGIQNPLQALDLLAKVAATQDQGPQIEDFRGYDESQKDRGAHIDGDAIVESLVGTPFVGLETHTFGALLEK